MDFVQRTAGTCENVESIHKDNMGGNLSIDEAKMRLAEVNNVVLEVKKE